MKIILKILILLIILATSLFIQIKAALILENDFAKLVSCDETIVKMTSFKFYKKSRNFGALNVSYILYEDITSDEQLKIQISALQFRGNEYKKTVVDFSIGICTIYKVNKFDALSIIKNSNLTGCPFSKGAYYINDIAPSAAMLPPFFPEGKWLVDLNFIHRGKVITQVNWMMTVRKSL